MKKKSFYKALGIMNGTSLDGVDYALIKSSSDLRGIKFIGHQSFSIPKKLKKQLLKAASNELSSYGVSQLHYDLGRLYARHAQILLKNWKWDVVGLHGQTIHHQGGRATFQVGYPGFLAQVSPVVYDFRGKDIIFKGEGAPLAPFFQKALYSSLRPKPVAFHNLGGISNLTYLKGTQMKAFDTGPANILLDIWVQSKGKGCLDTGGSFSQRGLTDPLVVRSFLKHKYFSKKSPKSCGREEFNGSFIKKYGGGLFLKLSFEDQMACLVDLTARSIGQAYGKEVGKKLDEIYFYGGGVYNSHLMERISYFLPHVYIKRTDELGWPSQAFEASAFAFLALAHIFNKKSDAPPVTGASHPYVLGQLFI